MASITPIVAFRHQSVPDTTRFPQETIFSDDEGKGKKYALRKAIQSATTDFVWLLDDDVINANQQWEIVKKANLTADLTILPLRMTAGNGRLIERLQQTEYVGIQALTLLSAERGRAVMCSGANLVVRRERWLESYDSLHPDMPSGDDMFLLESFKLRQLTISTLCTTVDIAPVPSLGSLLRQRMRWAGKAPKYTDKDIRRCAMLVGCLNLLAVVCPPLWLLKFATEVYVLHYARKHYPMLFLFEPSFLWFLTAVLLSLLYPWYMLICLAGGLIKNKRDNKKQSHSFL